jgi:ParB family chromosome partitioning protein
MNAPVKRTKGLGRGLDALLGADQDAPSAQGPQTLPVARLRPGKYQPRTRMQPEALAELAASIGKQGVIQPILVRPVGADQFEIIAGERRFRAAQMAGLSEVPVVVREVPDEAALAMALIENIQRQELTPLEEAQALQRLIDEFDLTHQQAADAVGRSRAAVSNLLRLMELPASIKQLLDESKLEMGHARALLTLPASVAEPLALEAARHGWTVRELEEAARKAQLAPKGKARTSAADPNVANLERELAERFATRVELAQGRGGKGKLIIHYHSLDELDGILTKVR